MHNTSYGFRGIVVPSWCYGEWLHECDFIDFFFIKLLFFQVFSTWAQHVSAFNFAVLPE